MLIQKGSSANAHIAGAWTHTQADQLRQRHCIDLRYMHEPHAWLEPRRPHIFSDLMISDSQLSGDDDRSAGAASVE